MVHVKRFTSKTQQYGKIGEDEAVAYLLTQGFEVVARNVSGSFGEIDIIARRQGIHYFFEVKAGRVGSGVNPAESLTEAKIRKVAKTAAYYAMIHRISEYRIEGVVVQMKGKEAEVERIDLF